jgi:hypothetical protein
MVFLSIVIKLYHQSILNDSYENLSQKQTNLSLRQIELPPDKIKQIQQQINPSDIENLLNLNKTIVINILLEVSPKY